MKRTKMLCKNYEFERVFKKGCYFNAKHLTLYIRPRKDEQIMLGITVSKKVKGNVNRNQIKRWLREIYRLNEMSIQTGIDLIMFGRTSPKETDYHALLANWQKLASHANILYTDRTDFDQEEYAE